MIPISLKASDFNLKVTSKSAVLPLIGWMSFDRGGRLCFDLIVTCVSFCCLSCIYCEVFSDEVAMESRTEPLCGRLWLLLSSQPEEYRSTMKGSSKLSPWGVFGEKDIFRLFSRTQTLEIVERIRTRHCQNVDLSDLLHSNGDLSDAFWLLEIYQFVWDAWVECTCGRTLPHSVCDVSKSFKYSWTWKV